LVWSMRRLVLSLWLLLQAGLLARGAFRSFRLEISDGWAAPDGHERCVVRSAECGVLGSVGECWGVLLYCLLMHLHQRRHCFQRDNTWTRVACSPRCPLCSVPSVLHPHTGRGAGDTVEIMFHNMMMERTSTLHIHGLLFAFQVVMHFFFLLFFVVAVVLARREDLSSFALLRVCCVSDMDVISLGKTV
jgi:hypothetical protein